ncbi:redox-sensing transcriptional repressor Rex [Timonella sp. A28]|uniref:redox-sensing transcriptional repressor Rex n=1 Tax=Timonella sp. A28 TaxID=3442640 RepID=UPI003EB817F0
MVNERLVPLATVERVPQYLRAIGGLISHGDEHAPSAVLAERSGVSSAQFRKDMSLIGAHGGVRGSGYELVTLRAALGEVLGSRERVKYVIVGVGNLGSALASSSAFRRGGVDVVGLFDTDPARVGAQVAGLTVLHDDQLADVIREHGVSIAVLATSESSAQLMADVVVGAGVREILNFVPVVLQVPSSVEVRSVDLGVELQMLAFHARNR